MREIVLDTETTGLDPAAGHRIVEVAAIELVNTVPTGASFHRYANPEREMPPEAFEIHGLSDAFLSQHPTFDQLIEELLGFIGDATLVIHNASFDIKFVNAELTRTGHPLLSLARAIDTIEIAKRKFPGARYSLDELCRRFAIDLTQRSKHGALLDADLTAQVYLELIGGRQRGLALAPAEIEAARNETETGRARMRPEKLLPLITPEELALHAAFVASELGGKSLWAQ
jgi:DNA polymerase-3 subunit epsilon